MQRGNQEDDRHAEDQIARRKLGLAVHIRHAALVLNGNPLQLSNRVLEALEHRQAGCQCGGLSQKIDWDAGES
jgi:hypothetical protein